MNMLIRGINSVNTNNQGSIKCSILLFYFFSNYWKEPRLRTDYRNFGIFIKKSKGII
jgi:hypothetical protein